MDFKTIVYTVDGPIATITLNRPERLNALVPPMPAEIEEAVGVRATVEWFLRQGWAVVVADANPDTGQALLAELDGRGDVVFVRTDVSDEDQVAAAVHQAATI